MDILISFKCVPTYISSGSFSSSCMVLGVGEMLTCVCTVKLSRYIIKHRLLEALTCILRLQNSSWNQLYCDYSIQAAITLRYISGTWLSTQGQIESICYGANHMMEIHSVALQNVCAVSLLLLCSSHETVL